MIFEQTATQAPSPALRVRRLADIGNFEFTGFRSTGWRTRLPGVVTSRRPRRLRC